MRKIAASAILLSLLSFVPAHADTHTTLVSGSASFYREHTAGSFQASMQLAAPAEGTPPGLGGAGASQITDAGSSITIALDCSFQFTSVDGNNTTTWIYADGFASDMKRYLVVLQVDKIVIGSTTYRAEYLRYYTASSPYPCLSIFDNIGTHTLVDEGIASGWPIAVTHPA